MRLFVQWWKQKDCLSAKQQLSHHWLHLSILLMTYREGDWAEEGDEGSEGEGEEGGEGGEGGEGVELAKKFV